MQVLSSAVKCTLQVLGAEALDIGHFATDNMDVGEILREGVTRAIKQHHRHEFPRVDSGRVAASTSWCNCDINKLARTKAFRSKLTRVGQIVRVRWAAFHLWPITPAALGYWPPLIGYIAAKRECIEAERSAKQR